MHRCRLRCLRYELRAGDDSDLCRKVFRLARDRSWELAELRPVERDLESVFRDLVAEYESGDDASREPSSKSSRAEQSGPVGAA